MLHKWFASAQDRVSCATHAMGAVLALAGGVLFLLRGLGAELPAAQVAPALCFCLSMIALYTASAVYHFYPGDVTTGGVKRLLRKLDHSMIYVLIAGSYTPFSLALLPYPEGKRFCLLLWGIAVVGILAKLVWINAPRLLSTLFYLAMGWAVLFVLEDFLAAAEPGCMALITAGGVCYSVGAVFYAIKRPNLSAEWTFHELFHLLILAGSLCHYLAVYLYVL